MNNINAKAYMCFLNIGNLMVCCCITGKKEPISSIEYKPCSHVILEIMYMQPAVQSHLLQTESTGIWGHDLAHRSYDVLGVRNGDKLCGVMKLMWLRLISNKSQAAQFYTCCREQMVLADKVAGGGAVVATLQRKETRSSGAKQKGEKRLRWYVKLCNNLHGCTIP